MDAVSEPGAHRGSGLPGPREPGFGTTVRGARPGEVERTEAGGAEPAPAAMDDPEVELARLAAAAGPLRRVQAALAERLVASDAPARLCYARLADYARERLGRSGRQVQELVRVHRALARLPELERALSERALSWSKVRLVARVAEPEDEGEWIARARAVTVRRLEEEVAAHARAVAAARDDAAAHGDAVAHGGVAAHGDGAANGDAAARGSAAEDGGAGTNGRLDVANGDAAARGDAAAHGEAAGGGLDAANGDAVAHGGVAAHGDGASSGGLDAAAEDSGPEARVVVHCTPALREKWSVAHEVAERVAGQRLRAGDALEQVTAEALGEPSLTPEPATLEREETLARQDRELAEQRRAAARARAEAREAEDAAEARAADRTTSSGEWDAEGAPDPPAPAAPPDEVAALGAGLEEADAFELDRRLRRAVHLEQTIEARMAPLLRVVTAREYVWRRAWRPLSEYAPELGLSVTKARALMRLERLSEACPELRAAYRAGRLSWVKAHALLPLLLLDVGSPEGDWRAAWVDWAARVTVRRLEEDVERMLQLRAGHPAGFDRAMCHPEHAQDPVPETERPMCAPPVHPDETQELAFRVPYEVAALFRAVRETARTQLRTKRRREADRVAARPAREAAAEPPPLGEGPGGEPGSVCSRAATAAVRHPLRPFAPEPTDGEVFEAILDRVLATWLARDPAAPRPDPVIERDGYRCAVPGCTSRRNLHDHHVVFRSHGGPDDPANRLATCAFHHQRCLHAGRLAIRGRAPDALVFELGRRPAAPPLARYRSGDVELSVEEEPWEDLRDLARGSATGSARKWASAEGRV